MFDTTADFIDATPSHSMDVFPESQSCSQTKLIRRTP